jgi:putative tryptophan/tyrosine transport system substrate-binding protein
VRRFLALVVIGALFTAAVPALGQTDRLPRIGVLVPGVPPRDVFEALRTGLEELGCVDGKTKRLDVRWNPEDSSERWTPLAAELIDLGVVTIVGGTTVSTGAVKRLTATIPVVSATLNDPVRAGLIRSFAQPGGNITGVALITPELIEKRVQLAAEALPGLGRIGILWRVDELGEFQRRAAEAAARALDLKSTECTCAPPTTSPLPSRGCAKSASTPS